MKELTIVVPFFNDGYLASALFERIEDVFQGYWADAPIHEALEVICVDDGSSQESKEKLTESAERFPFAKIIFLTRNFGQHIAVSCGYAHSEGAITAMMNADMQEDPSCIKDFIATLKEDEVDIVYGLRSSRSDGVSEKVTSHLFNGFLNAVTGQRIPLNRGTIRVMSRRFLESYNELDERSRFLPGLETWLGFEAGEVSVEHRDRKEGKSSYTFKKRFKMAMDAIVGFSDFPLRCIAWSGMFVALAGFLLTCLTVVLKLMGVQFLPGYASILCAVVSFSGLQIFLVGISALYIGRVLKEVQRRPLYVINKKIGL